MLNCDTFVALGCDLFFLSVLCERVTADSGFGKGNTTHDGSVIFGKNSDRPANEAVEIRFFPR
jgi:hypothetical protein